MRHIPRFFTCEYGGVSYDRNVLFGLQGHLEINFLVGVMLVSISEKLKMIFEGTFDDGAIMIGGGPCNVQEVLSGTFV